MDKSQDDIKIHASSGGKLYVDQDEYFKAASVVAIIRKLFESETYRRLKKNDKNRATA